MDITKLNTSTYYVPFKKLEYSIISDFITMGDNERFFFLFSCSYASGHFTLKYRIPEIKSIITFYDDLKGGICFKN